MAGIMDSKTKISSPKSTPVDRLCARCHRTKPETDFYANKSWTDQKGRDLWCKECAAKCMTKDAVKEYFWENNREWEDSVWDRAKERALKNLKTNTTYQQSAEDRRAMLLERCTAQQIWSAYPSGVKYSDNTKNGYYTYAEAKKQGIIGFEDKDDEKKYNEFFNGYFTNRDLEYMQHYYEGLDNAFALDDESLKDYARKAARASLRVDRAQDDFAAGRCSYTDVKDAIAVFDTLMKSANFAACKRKEKNVDTTTSFSEISYLLETTGHAMQRKIEWEQDDVDKNIRHLQHTVAAISAEGV